ncbi:MAG: ribonuclease HI [Bacteroidota bacterium]|jgi:ribonuclease HI|nr:ribonuclease HI [Bacteroidota bacterium]NLP19953.1 ribonuclease HI [Bacteroidales bacterium]
MDKPNITIYTDGACSGNPGPGGYGIVLISGQHRKEMSQGFRLTTNNRMELLAVIVALEQLKKENSNVTLYTDSKYVSEAINEKWIEDWVRRKFKKVKNPDLWKRFLDVYKKHNVEVVWVKGHSETVENNRCDFLATQAIKSTNLLIDENYENPVETQGKLLF